MKSDTGQKVMTQEVAGATNVQERAQQLLKKANIGTLWQVFLGLGALHFVFYYASIEYLPPANLESLSTALAVLAGSGILFYLMFALIWQLPAELWLEFAPLNQKKRGEDESLVGFQKETVQFFYIPMLIVAPIHVLAIWLGFVFLHEPPWVVLALNCASILAFLVTYFRFRTGVWRSNFLPPTLCAAGLFHIPSLLSIAWVAGAGQSDLQIFLTWAVFLLFLVVLWSVRLILFQDRRWALFMVAVVFVGLAMIQPENLLRAPRAAMSAFGLGHYDARVVVSEKWFDILREGVSEESPGLPEGPGLDVRVLSNLGPELYVEIDRYRFTIPRSEVSSVLRKPAQKE